MALVKLSLTFPERHLVDTILGDLEHLTIADARNVRELTRVFDLREVRKEIRELEEVIQKTGDGQNRLQWSHIVDEELTKQKPRTFTIDDSYLRWFEDIIKDRDWTRRVGINPSTGQSIEYNVPVSTDQAITIANLSDTIKEAEKVKKQE